MKSEKKTISLILISVILITSIVIMTQVNRGDGSKIKQIAKVEEDIKKASTVGPESELSKWLYEIDNDTGEILLRRYTEENQTLLTIYSKYMIDGKEYSTAIYRKWR